MYITIYRKWKIYCNFSFCVGELGDHEGMACRTGYLSEFQFFPGQVCYSQNDLFTNLYKKKKSKVTTYAMQGLSPSCCKANSAFSSANNASNVTTLV